MAISDRLRMFPSSFLPFRKFDLVLKLLSRCWGFVKRDCFNMKPYLHRTFLGECINSNLILQKYFFCSFDFLFGLFGYEIFGSLCLFNIYLNLKLIPKFLFFKYFLCLICTRSSEGAPIIIYMSFQRLLGTYADG